MFSVMCNIERIRENNSEVDNNSHVAEVLELRSVESNKFGRGCVVVALGEEVIIVDGNDLIIAIENCLNNGKHSRYRRVSSHVYDDV